MITIKKYAAIVIGSNAMRLLITNIVEQDDKEPQFNKNALVRVPIRLGQDSFTVGEISPENMFWHLHLLILRMQMVLTKFFER